MIKFYIIFLLILANCEPKKEHQKMINQSKKEESATIKTQDSLNFQDLKFLSKQEALQKYGNPVKNEKFILNDGPLEFRIELLNFYTKEEIQSNSVEIEEYTWEKDKNTWITAWYQINSKESIPKDIYIWKKGTEF